jgi:hypothetical protein
MFERLTGWFRCVSFPQTASAKLGFGVEYWDLDPTHYEGWEQLRDCLTALGRTPTKRNLAYELTSHLLDDVIVAAGGVEHAIVQLREALGRLTDYASIHNMKPKDRIPVGLSHEASAEAWYAFSDVLSWSRTVVERLKRQPVDRKRFPEQGLIPAIRPKQLRKRCDSLLNQLRTGPVSQARPLANFLLHSAMVQHPFSGVQIDNVLGRRYMQGLCGPRVQALRLLPQGLGGVP